MKKEVNNTKLRKLLNKWEFSNFLRWAGLSLIIGIVAGLGSVLFVKLSDLLSKFALGELANYYPTGPANEAEINSEATNSTANIIPWLIILIPTIGGLLAGLIVQLFAPEAAGHGTDAAVVAYHTKRGKVRARVPIVKLISSSIVLGTGGSGGREGPIAQIGSGFSSWISQKFRLNAHDRRILFAAGMGAGIAAVFRAPLAAAIYSAEVMYRDPDLESEVLIPSIIASIIAYCTSCLFNGFEPLFATNTAKFIFDKPQELIPYTILAIILGLSSLFFIKFFYGTESFFRKIKLPMFVKTGIGGLLTGLIGLICLQFVVAIDLGATAEFQSLSVLSFGYGIIQDILSNELTLVVAALLIIVAIGKLLTTSFTIGSGGSAGLFGPSMVIGGAIGGALGAIFYHYGLTDEPSKYVILGMVGFFGGAAKVPISSVIMVSEITGTYGLLIPSLWVVTFCYLVTRGDTLYRSQPKNHAESLAHRSDFVFDLLKGLTVNDIISVKNKNCLLIPENMTLTKMIPKITSSSQTCFPVIDKDSKLLGEFSMNTISEILSQAELMGDLITAGDVARKHIKPLIIDEELNSALLKFTAQKVTELPVLDKENKIIGMITEHEIIAEYQRKLVEFKKSMEDSIRTPKIK